MEASEVAAHGCDGIGMASGLKVEEGFFFDGVYVLGDNLSIDKGIERSAPVFAHPADAPFAIGNLAMMRTEKTVDKIFISFIVETGFHIILVVGSGR